MLLKSCEDQESNELKVLSDQIVKEISIIECTYCTSRIRVSTKSKENFGDIGAAILWLCSSSETT